ncbi:hypothetical protein FOZ63_026639 [Perkinsus olseni]|uniref:Lipase maturation factor 2 n=1 Tax=Perkinsus olseni TaxID=32597 RepID=A0A7J6T8G0_PEROL|nr:hypothetical protein FOZ63_026639 [Perkinsus olseni]
MSVAGGPHWLLQGLQQRLSPAVGRSTLGAACVTAILLLTACTMLYESVYCMGVYEAYVVAERTRVSIHVMCILAFLSLRWQLPGLCGTSGIIPAGNRFAEMRNLLSRGLELPRVSETMIRAEIITHAWMRGEKWPPASERKPDHDVFTTRLVMLCDIGLCSALAGIFLPFPLSTLSLALCWFAYWVLKRSCGTFLNLQWDQLLLECSALGCALSVPPLRLGAVWSLRMLLFKLVLSSGLCKVLSGCPKWSSLTAMDYHFWTQPLPTIIGYHLNRRLTPRLSRLMVWFTLFVQVFPVPWLLLLPYPFGAIGVWWIVLLMILIAFTGNYGFFNYLTCALALTVPLGGTRRDDPYRLSDIIAICYGLVVGLGVTQPLLYTLDPLHSACHWASSVGHYLRPMAVGSGYGLFARMTTFRMELNFEAEVSPGGPWREIVFKHKPVDPTNPPYFLPIGHMPRLDWRLWFVPLGLMRGAPMPTWVDTFIERMLRHEPCVVDGLLPRQAFDWAAVSRVRVVLWNYTFGNDGWARERLDTLYVASLGPRMGLVCRSPNSPEQPPTPSDSMSSSEEPLIVPLHES